jgi:hypothetical protein
MNHFNYNISMDNDNIITESYYVIDLSGNGSVFFSDELHIESYVSDENHDKEYNVNFNEVISITTNPLRATPFNNESRDFIKKVALQQIKKKFPKACVKHVNIITTLTNI